MCVSVYLCVCEREREKERETEEGGRVRGAKRKAWRREKECVGGVDQGPEGKTRLILGKVEVIQMQFFFFFTNFNLMETV